MIVKIRIFFNFISLYNYLELEKKFKNFNPFLDLNSKLINTFLLYSNIIVIIIYSTLFCIIFYILKLFHHKNNTVCIIFLTQEILKHFFEVKILTYY